MSSPATNTNTNQSQTQPEARLVDRLRKVLALTNNPNEHEAKLAAETLQRLLTEHNLSMADLEQRGAASKPQIKEEGHDLGKAAFNWKLDLAEVIADHYYCWAFVDRYKKTVKFIGRPDNVESLQMLYAWIIDQIKRISGEERKTWMEKKNGEHVDPLRWQVNFGLGVVGRIGARLRDLREQQSSQITALVVSHKSEISDYLELQYGKRIDGKPTKQEEQWEKEWQERHAAKELLKATDIEAYYNAYPWERPLTPEQQVEQDKAEEEMRKRQERNARRRKGRSSYRHYSAEDERKDAQSYEANRAGRSAADKVNLEPFLKGREGKGELL